MSAAAGLGKQISELGGVETPALSMKHAAAETGPGEWLLGICFWRETTEAAIAGVFASIHHPATDDRRNCS
jgi:hypothetical protein